MVGFLCFFFPPVIAVALTAKIRKETFGVIQFWTHYAVFAVIINGIMFWLLSFMFNPHWISSQDVFSTSFSAKYITLSSILAVVLAYFVKGLSKFKSLSTELSKDEDMQKNTDKKE